MPTPAALDSPAVWQADAFMAPPAPPAIALPPGPWVCLASRFALTAYHDDGFADFGVAFPDTLRRAVPKRRAEFLAGRRLAREALLRLTGRAADIAIGPQREPLWPDGVRGSISHSGDLAVCLATAAADALVGIDVENLLAPSGREAVLRMCTREEELPLLQTSPLGETTALTLLFSAKEALFKALFPRVGSYFDFQAASLRELDPAAGRLTLTLTEDLGQAYRAGQRVPVRFAIEATRVISWIAMGGDEAAAI
ncbi:4'-phosphopantetheinyl transferase family protein [Chromobacterium vaccinii]|uniref:4'-phosphopantetheinyl transferase family protein n=1 Tax=Chromobacterium vaccinii TaxID=1108595 RepID=UPI003C76521C